MTSTAALFIQKPNKPGVWETIGAALRLMREHPLALILPIAITQVFVTMGSLITGGATPGGEQLRVDLFLVLGLVQWVLGSLGVGATVFVVATLRWEKVLGAGEAFNALFQRLLPWLAITVFGWLLSLPAGFGGREMMDRPVLGAALTLVWLGPVMYLSLRFGVSQQLLLLEGRGPVEALRRSWRIMSGYMLRLLGIVVVEAVVASVLGFGVTFGLAAADAPSAVSTIVIHVIGIPIGVVGVAAVTLYYLRIREATP